MVTGLLMDRFNGHRVLVMMGVLAVAGLALAPLSPLLLLLTLLFMLLGFAEVSLNAGGNTLLLWLHRDAAGPNVSALHFCFSFGNMLTPLIMIAALSLTGQFHLTFWIVAASVAAMLWPLSRFVSPSLPTVDPNPTSLATLKHRDPLLLGLFMLLFSLYVGIEITFAGWVTAYGTLSGLTTEHAALLATLFWLALSAVTDRMVERLLGAMGLDPVALADRYGTTALRQAQGADDPWLGAHGGPGEHGVGVDDLAGAGRTVLAPGAGRQHRGHGRSPVGVVGGGSAYGSGAAVGGWGGSAGGHGPAVVGPCP